MIGLTAYLGIACMIVFGLALPLTAAVWWVRTRHEKVTTVLAGAATWFLFALVLEAAPKAVFLNPALPIGRKVLGSPALYTALGALMAGVFEETGRLVAFQTVLKKRRNRETAVSHGVGHGGMEAFFLLTVTGAQNLAYALLIRSGRFGELLEAAAAKGVDTAALEALPAQLAALTPLSACLALGERVSGMLLHAGLSVLVFYACKRSRYGLFGLAVLLHALFDVPAALWQVGVFPTMYLLEGILFLYAAVFLAVVIAALYRKDGGAEAAEADAPV